MQKIAVISAILDYPEQAMIPFNEAVLKSKHLVIGRMGIPLMEYGISVISITVKGELNEINALTGKLGKIDGINIKTSISKKEF